VEVWVKPGSDGVSTQEGIFGIEDTSPQNPKLMRVSLELLWEVRREQGTAAMRIWDGKQIAIVTIEKPIIREDSWY